MSLSFACCSDILWHKFTCLDVWPLGIEVKEEEHSFILDLLEVNEGSSISTGLFITLGTGRESEEESSTNKSGSYWVGIFT